MEAQKQQAVPQTPNQAQVAPVTQQQPTSEDVLKRVSQNTIKETQQLQESPKVSISLDDIKDPNQRKLIEDRLAEVNKAVSKTFGEIGSEKGKLLKEIEDLKSKQNLAWTPQRIQDELLRRQDFINSAQQLQAQAAPNGWEGSQEEWSALTPNEKKQFQSLVANQNNMNQQMNQLLISQLDSQLKTKYPDYDPSQVDSFYKDSYEGRIGPDRVREMIYKALNYEQHVKRAYELAVQDRSNINQERINGISVPSSPATVSSDQIERKNGESSRSFFGKIGQEALRKVAQARINQRA